MQTRSVARTFSGDEVGAWLKETSSRRSGHPQTIFNGCQSLFNFFLHLPPTLQITYLGLLIFLLFNGTRPSVPIPAGACERHRRVENGMAF